MSNKDPKHSVLGRPVDRRAFLRSSALGLGAMAVGLGAAGCGGDSSSDAPAPVGPPRAAVPSRAAWKFGVMSDTQWVTVTSGDDGKNPNSCPVEIVKALNAEFARQGVKFVVQVGDLVDSASSDKSPTSTRTRPDGSSYSFTNAVAEDTRALFTQGLYAAGIGFFPLRGNHDAAKDSAAEFQRIFPQTQNGGHNATPADVFQIANPDAADQPSPVKSGAAFTLGSSFGSPSDNLKGLSYAFDHQNARFVLLDQFGTTDGLNADGSPYGTGSAIAAQQKWIDGALDGKPAGGHAFVFAHKGLVTQDHVDVLFGADPSAASSPGMDAFITSLASRGVRIFFCGHDHMHDRSLVSTIDGSARVTQVVGASDSNKFYCPASPSNDEKYCGGKRQTLLAQERNTVGYYVFTVDGPTVTVEFYSAPVYPTPATGGQIATVPVLSFTLREKFGYALNGKEFVVAQSGAYSAVQDQGPGGTVARILAGANGTLAQDLSGRPFQAAVNTGWLAADGTRSDILLLQGLAADLGSDVTDPFVLSLSYTGDVAEKDLAAGKLVLAAPGDDGAWAPAVNRNAGGSTQLVGGPWKPIHGLGTHGVDPATRTVWAVLNRPGYFAAVAV